LSLLTDLVHPEVISASDVATSACALYEEVEKPAEDVDGKIIQVRERVLGDQNQHFIYVQEYLGRLDTLYEGIVARPAKLPLRAKSGKQRTGLSDVAFSDDSLLLATRDENAPRVAYVWDLQRLTLTSTLAHKDPGEELV